MVVVGTIQPWIECELLRHSAKRVVTIDYNPITSRVKDPRLQTQLWHDVAATVLDGTHEVPLGPLHRPVPMFIYI